VAYTGHEAAAHRIAWSAETTASPYSGRPVAMLAFGKLSAGRDAHCAPPRDFLPAHAPPSG